MYCERFNKKFKTVEQKKSDMKNQKLEGGSVMKNIICLIMGVMLVTLALGFSTNTAMADDTMPGSAHVKVLLDNDQVRVSEARRPPGTIVPMHTHPTLIGYYFSPATVKVTSADGKSKVKNIPAGKLIWKPNGMTHAIEIMGDKDQHVLVIEWKKK